MEPLTDLKQVGKNLGYFLKLIIINQLVKPKFRPAEILLHKCSVWSKIGLESVGLIEFENRRGAGRQVGKNHLPTQFRRYNDGHKSLPRNLKRKGILRCPL